MNISKLHKLIDGKTVTKSYILKKTGLTRPTLDSILDGNDFKVSNLEKIAAALNVKVGYFFDEEITQVREAGRDYIERGKIIHRGTEINSPLSIAQSDLEKENSELKRQLIEAQAKIISLIEQRENQKQP